MKNGLIPIDVKNVIPTPAGFAVFVGNEEKTFVIYVGEDVGAAILMFMKGIKKPRPLTHDLIGSILKGLEVSVDRVVINDLRENTFYARLFLSEAVDHGRKKMVQIDARPSDCLAIAKQVGTRIYVARKVFDQVSDVSHLFEEGKGKEE